MSSLAHRVTKRCRQVEGDLKFVATRLIGGTIGNVKRGPLALLTLFERRGRRFEGQIKVSHVRRACSSCRHSCGRLSTFIQRGGNIRSIALQDLSQAFCSSFRMFLQASHGLGPGDIRRRLCHLGGLAVQTIDRNALQHSPCYHLRPRLPGEGDHRVGLRSLGALVAAPIRGPRLRFIQSVFVFSAFAKLTCTSLGQLSSGSVARTNSNA